MSTAVIIIPTYNERENVTQVLSRLSEVFAKISKWKMKVLVVDDTSPDKTYEVVTKLKKKYPWLSLLINKRKSGLGGAYLKGMAYAFDEMGADVAFEFDADSSHDPTKIPEFLAAIDHGADLVLGSRYMKGGGIPDNWGWHRKFFSVVGNLIIMTVLTDFKIRDWTTGFRAVTRKVYEAVHGELHSERFSGYTFQIGFLHKAVRKGFVIKEVPFRFVDRTHGKSKLGPEYIKNTLLYIFKVRIQEILAIRFVKFALVGGVGAAVQLLSLQLFRALITQPVIPYLTAYQAATILSIELAVISNFIWSNLWTFADRKLKVSQFPSKFIQFNLASLGSILIQFTISSLGERFIGLFMLFTLPLVGIRIDTGLVYAVVGIIVGMLWNFFAYSTFIWKRPT